jgi:hypothetical protein
MYLRLIEDFISSKKLNMIGSPLLIKVELTKIKATSKPASHTTSNTLNLLAINCYF